MHERITRFLEVVTLGISQYSPRMSLETATGTHQLAARVKQALRGLTRSTMSDGMTLRSSKGVGGARNEGLKLTPSELSDGVHNKRSACRNCGVRPLYWLHYSVPSLECTTS